MSSEVEASKPSDPSWAKEYREKRGVPWYLDSIDHKVTSEVRLRHHLQQRNSVHLMRQVDMEQMRTLLEDYSHVPSSDVLKHVATIRDKAWAIRSYPCTGLGLWLIPMIPKTPIYTDILTQLKEGARFLDIGCFLGQDLRRLVFDGAPSKELFGMDIVSHWDVGYDLFRDRDRFSARFIEADILFPNAALRSLEGTVDIISITHLLHQWDWKYQYRCLVQLVRLSSGLGTVVAGFQVGITPGGKEAASEWKKSSTCLQSPGSFAEMWDQVGKETGTKWVCDAMLLTWEEGGWDPKDTEYLGEDARILRFVVNRVG